MSDCLDDNTALELLEGRLASARRAAVERHIESCEACRELVAELAKDTSGAEAEIDAPVPTERPVETPADLSRAGPYRVEREVGSGAAGTVYRAVDERTGQVVALKYVTDAAWRLRFAREAETLARLVHPGIVRYVGHGETRQGLYLAMEWLEGEDLASCLDRGRLPWPAVRVLGLRLAAALAHAHALDAVHRDLKPCNIFLPGRHVEQAKLLDFGLVRVRDSLERTASQAVLGTPHYMAPEQVKDPRSVDARSDLFSLGVVFFEALSGVRPFEADDLFTVWLKIVDQPAPNLRALAPDVPEAFVVLVERLLAKDPAARPANAAEVHEALVMLDAGGQNGTVSTAVERPLQPRSTAPPNAPPPTAPPPTAPPSIALSAPAPPRYPYGLMDTHRIEPPQTRNIALIVAIAGVALVLIAGALVLVLARRIPRERTLASEPSTESVAVPSPSPSPEPASAPIPVASTASPSREILNCGGAATEMRRGGNYQPDPDAKDSPPVIINGLCRAVLEDCIIGGTSSILVNGQSQLTLRRCKVSGRTTLNGDVVLTLDGTTLPSPPQIVGKARVIRQ